MLYVEGSNTSTKGKKLGEEGGCNVTVTVPPKDRGTRWHRSWQRGQPSLPHESSAQDKSKMQNPMILETWILKERVLRDGLIWQKKSHDIKTLKFHGVSRMLLEKSIGWGWGVQTAGFKIADFARNLHDPMILETVDFEAVGSSRWVGLGENFRRHKNSKIS